MKYIVWQTGFFGLFDKKVREYQWNGKIWKSKKGTCVFDNVQEMRMWAESKKGRYIQRVMR